MSMPMEEALKILDRDPVLHADMSEPLRRGHGQVLACQGDGVLILEEHTGAYMLSSCGPETTKALLEKASDASFLVVHGEQARDLANQMLGFDGCMAYRQAVYLAGESFPPPEVAAVLAADVELTSLSGALMLPTLMGETFDVAKDCMTENLNRTLLKGWTPFAQAQPRDETAIFLFKELGMEMAAQEIYRLYKK